MVNIVGELEEEFGGSPISYDVQIDAKKLLEEKSIDGQVVTGDGRNEVIIECDDMDEIITIANEWGYEYEINFSQNTIRLFDE